MSTVSKLLRRPKCVTKYYLINHFDISYKVLWSRVLTHDLLEGWGYDYKKDIKPNNTFDPLLTRKIYEHFKMGIYEDVDDATIEIPGGNRAPDDNL